MWQQLGLPVLPVVRRALELRDVRLDFARSVCLLKRPRETAVQLHRLGRERRGGAALSVRLDCGFEGDVDGREQRQEVLVMSEPVQTGTVSILSVGRGRRGWSGPSSKELFYLYSPGEGDTKLWRRWRRRRRERVERERRVFPVRADGTLGEW